VREAPTPDEEHPRGQALLFRRLHRQSVDVLTSRAAFPRTASTFAIAWHRQCRSCLAIALLGVVTD
jgi:hypothetical protein